MATAPPEAAALGLSTSVAPWLFVTELGFSGSGARWLV